MSDALAMYVPQASVAQNDTTERIEMSVSGDQTVIIGNWVKILDLGDEEEDVFYLVDEAMANAAQSRISARSPFAQAILGSKPGQVVTFVTPGGIAKVKILDTGREKPR